SDFAARSGRKSRRAPLEYYAEECGEAWNEFDQQPGRYLRMGWVGLIGRELLTMEGQTIASMRGPTSLIMGSPLGQDITVSIDGRSFALRGMSTARSSSPSVHGISARISRDSEGHFAAETKRGRGGRAVRLRELVDGTGTPILYTSGRHFEHSAGASISFP